MKKVRTIFFIIIFFAVGCASSTITTTWKMKDAVPQYFNKIMVIGLMREADRPMQEKMEEHLVGDLKSNGYAALSSLQEYGPYAIKKGDTAAALLKLTESDVDAVLTIVLLDKEKEQQYISAKDKLRITGDGYEMYQRIFEPGYYVTTTKYFWETNLYNLKTKKLIYSIQTETFNPNDTESLAHQYGKLIIKNLLKEHVIVNKK